MTYISRGYSFFTLRPATYQDKDCMQYSIQYYIQYYSDGEEVYLIQYTIILIYNTIITIIL